MAQPRIGLLAVGFGRLDQTVKLSAGRRAFGRVADRHRGLMDRWSNYANSGHSGNTRIRDLHTKRGKDFAENFRFSILEIADKHTDKEEMMLKEIHWKRRLLTRDSGLNAN